MNTKFKKIAVFLVVVMTTLSLSMNAFAWGNHYTMISSPNDAFKLGCDYADSYIKGTANASFHGGNNYIASYIYLTKVADALGTNGVMVTENSIAATGVSSDLKNSIFGYQNGTAWVLTVKGKSFGAIFGTAISNTRANRKAFVYGLALHAATDVFSHDAWENRNGTWLQITHDNDDALYPSRSNADNPNYLYDGYIYDGINNHLNNFSQRYLAAKQVASNILTSYYNGGYGSKNDLLVAGTYFGTFYLKHYYDYGGNGFQVGDLDN